MLPSPLNAPNTALSQTTGDTDFLKNCGSMCNLPTGKNGISINIIHTYIALAMLYFGMKEHINNSLYNLQIQGVLA